MRVRLERDELGFGPHGLRGLFRADPDGGARALHELPVLPDDEEADAIRPHGEV